MPTLVMIDDFRLWESRRCRRMHAPPTKEGWLTKWRTPMATTTLLSQRAEPSPLWSRPCLESLVGSGLARIPLVGCDDRGGAAAGVSPPRPARHTRRVMVVRATPPFLALVRHRGGGGSTPKSTTSPPLFGGRSLHSDPWREGHRALPRSGRINRPVRFPHRRRDLRSLREKPVHGTARTPVSPAC